MPVWQVPLVSHREQAPELQVVEQQRVVPPVPGWQRLELHEVGVEHGNPFLILQIPEVVAHVESEGQEDVEQHVLSTQNVEMQSAPLPQVLPAIFLHVPD
jgi:hypothetical protein